MDTKKEIRKKVFAARKQRTDVWVEEMSKAITQRVVALPAFKHNHLP